MALHLRPIDVSANEKMRAPDVVSEPDAPRPETSRACDARSSRGCDGVTATRRPPGGSPQENRVAARVISGAQRVALGAWNALVGDDLRIVADAHASAVRRTIAGMDLALAIVPEGKVLELGAKLATRAAGRAAESTTARAAASAVDHAGATAEAACARERLHDLGLEHLATTNGAVHNAESVAIGYQPPWKAGSPVHDGRLLHDDHETFARVYRDAQDGTETRPLGPWLLRRADVAGKTPKQIKDAFALPYEPTHIVEIRLNAGFRVRVGSSGPNLFGPGGSEQIQTLSQLHPRHLGAKRSIR